MKKYLLTLLSLLIVGTMMAESASKDANRIKQQKARLVGITLGYSQSSMFETLPLLGTKVSRNNDVDRYHAFNCGIVLNPEIDNGIGILTGAMYIYTPTFQRIGNRTNYEETFISKHDLAIPLRFHYRYAFTPGFSVFAYTGPSFNIGLVWDKQNKTIEDNKIIESYTTGFYNDNNDLDSSNYSRFQCFWGLGVGIILNQHLRIEYCADWGLNNITPYSGKFTHLNLPVNVEISYMF